LALQEFMAQPVETVARPLLKDFNEVDEVVPAKQDYPIMQDAYEPPQPFFMHSDFLALEGKESKSPLVDHASGDESDAWC